MLMLTGATCAVRESTDTVAERVQSASRDSLSWFQATSDPEGEAIWVNASQVLWFGRERTPVEELT